MFPGDSVDEHTGALRAVTGPEPDQEEPVVGRDAELARLFRAMDSASADPVLLLLGDMGTGKSALLKRAVRRAEADGARVLRAEGSESESGLAFSALHQLLRPVPAEVDGLPEGQRAALQDAIGARPVTPRHPGQSAPGLMPIGVAVLSLLSAMGDRRPLLVVLDDAQWFDRASLDVLSFAVKRLEGEPVTTLIAARGGERIPGFDRHVPTLTLGPLDDVAADQLLDLQPKSPTGLVRTRILDQAGGNPLALVELTRAATAHETAPGPPSAGPLPLTDHLERIFAARLDGLPAATTRALLLLAAMDSVDSAIVASAGLPNAEDEAWRAAERAGLVRRTGRDVRFRHPLVRSAVYHAASLGAQREAHLALAEMLRDEPDRRAWHLAAACPRPDAAVSAELERTMRPGPPTRRSRGGGQGLPARRGTRAAARGERAAAGRSRFSGRVHRRPRLGRGTRRRGAVAHG